MDRAEEHLADLQEAVDTYVNSHPYRVSEGMEGKRNARLVRRLKFTSQPDDRITLMAADAIYNIRSGLDHLASALVPSNKRTSVMFPVFFQGVWEPNVEGENPQRVKDRERWISYTRNMAPEAVEILKVNQPDDSAGDDDNLHGLAFLNRLSNTDRHTKLPIVGSRFRNVIIKCTLDGIVHAGTADLGHKEAFDDDEEIPVPPEATDVEALATAVVTIRIGKSGGYPIPGALWYLVTETRRMIDMLRPYDRL